MTGWRDSPTQVLLSQADLLETLIATNSAMGEGFAIIDGGRIMVANDAFCHISGYAAEELRALPSFLHLVHPDERALVADRHARRMAGEEQPSRYRSRLVTKDGRSVPIELGVSRVPNCSRVVIIFRDLTLQTQIEESLRHDTQIQLMITDVVMPEMSGRELVARLRTIRPALRVIYMSGYTDDAVVRHGVAEAGIAFLQKPFTPDVLLTKVRRVLDGEREG